MTYVLSSAKLDATGHRWVSALSSYNFKILYRPGKSNVDADGLSRLNHDVISSEYIKAVCNICQPYAETLAFDHVICQSMQTFDGIGEQFDMVTLQFPFENIKVIKGVRPKKKLLQCDNDIIFYRNFSKLRVRNNVLIRDVKTEDQTVLQHVIPASTIPVVLRNLHNKMGH